MPRYIVQSTHTPEECLQALDDFLAQGEDRLASWDFGCAAGDDHVAYTTMQAADESGARSQLPANLRAGASLSEVGKFTGAQIRAFHAT